jgi:phospholipid N-methyltransferase
MIQKLPVNANSYILEPCAGDGVFIDALLNINQNVKIDAFEIDKTEANKLKNKYSSQKNISVMNEDTLLYRDFISGKCNNKYDFIIANPPYGAWQDYAKRAKLKTIYPNLYVKETYSTFLFLCLSLLKKQGKMVFITPDTYLNLHTHTFLRKYILQNSMIDEIALFPVSFFPGVNFGYSKLSIITMTKQNDKGKLTNNKIIIRDNFKNPKDLLDNNSRVIVVKQIDVFQNTSHAFIVSDDKNLERLLKYSPVRIGDIAQCVTGIYTGNDKEFIKVKDQSVKNSKNYKMISDYELYTNNEIPDLRGIDGDNTFIPIVKGGNTKYLKKDLWFINWSKDAVFYYRTNKKSRFQNSQYYFRKGIAIPMVSSHSVTASLIENKIFDQSIVGVFPKDNLLLLFLLAFFNTSICTKLLRLLNPSANNSANYIKKIPVIIPDALKLNHINKLVERLLFLKQNNEDFSFIEEELDAIFDMLFYDNADKINSIELQNELFAISQPCGA